MEKGELGMVAHTYNSSSGKVKTVENLRLAWATRSEFEDSLEYIMRPCKDERKKKKEQGQKYSRKCAKIII